MPDRNSHHVTFWRTGVGLWVVIDEQFEDALRLPDDPGFMPARPLAPEDLARIKESVTQPALDVVLSFLFKGLLVIALVAAGIFVLNRLWPSG